MRDVRSTRVAIIRIFAQSALLLGSSSRVNFSRAASAFVQICRGFIGVCGCPLYGAMLECSENIADKGAES